MLRTRFTELFGITYPIMSAPMGLHGQSAAFVNAVRPAADVLHTICDGAEAVLRSRPSQLLA